MDFIALTTPCFRPAGPRSVFFQRWLPRLAERCHPRPILGENRQSSSLCIRICRCTSDSGGCTSDFDRCARPTSRATKRRWIATPRRISTEPLRIPSSRASPTGASPFNTPPMPSGLTGSKGIAAFAVNSSSRQTARSGCEPHGLRFLESTGRPGGWDRLFGFSLHFYAKRYCSASRRASRDPPDAKRQILLPRRGGFARSGPKHARA
jgi:hypothetical protein